MGNERTQPGIRFTVDRTAIRTINRIAMDNVRTGRERVDGKIFSQYLIAIENEKNGKQIY